MSDTSNLTEKLALIESEAALIHWTKVGKELVEYCIEKGIEKYLYTDEESGEMKCIIIDMEGYK